MTTAVQEQILPTSINNKMKAAIVPAANERWKITSVPTPEPGPNQVLIRIHASGICYTDVHQTKGELPGTFPRILGHEPVGEIVALGPGFTTRRIGDRVGVPWLQSSCGRCEWCLLGRPMFCANQLGTSGQLAGGHAELMLAQAGATMLLPEGLSYPRRKSSPPSETATNNKRAASRPLSCFFARML